MTNAHFFVAEMETRGARPSNMEQLSLDETGRFVRFLL
jgi:hypothetical protein